MLNREFSFGIGNAMLIHSFQHNSLHDSKPQMVPHGAYNTHLISDSFSL